MRKRTALVTGASSGIGRAIALQLAKEDIEVCINFSKSEKQAQEVKQDIEKEGGKAALYQADITKEDQVKEMFNKLSSEFGILDMLVNNAGIYIPDFIETHNTENWKQVIEVNLYGKFFCTKYSLPLLKKSTSARIVNIASRAAVRPIEESSAYCSAAAAVTMFTQVSALELAQYNIRVNTVSPGLTKTPMTQEYDTDEDFESYAKKNPSKRIGKPTDIANIISFLISDKADFINGENINVSGGILLI